MPRTTDESSKFSRLLLQRRVGQLRPLLVSLGVAGMAAFAGWVLLASSWLAADRVTVNGARTVSAGQIAAAAGVDLGTPLLRLDLDAVDKRVSALPAVAAAAVHREWPSTVTITVTERQPVAAVHSSGSWWVLDKEGVLFQRTPKRAATLPLVDVSSGSDAAVVQEAAAVLAALPPDLLTRVQRLTASSMDSITLVLDDGREVRWGSSAEPVEKARVLSLLLSQPAQVYDVSVPAQPTTAD